MSNEAAKQTTRWIQDLAKTPVPDLDKTLERYLACLKPVISVAHYDRTKKDVQKFLDGEGRELQEALQKFANERDNWVTELWMEDMYLANPIPLPINSNPFYLLPKQNFQTTDEQLLFAAKIIQFCFHFKTLIDTEELTQDYGTGHGSGVPLCMQTYKHFFRACRVPGIVQDELIINSNNAEHFIVAIDNQFFGIFLDKCDQQNVEKIFQVLQCVVHLSKQDSNASMASNAAGLLTTENRRTWGKIRAYIESQNSISRHSLKCIENSLFVICLDDDKQAKAASNTSRSQRSPAADSAQNMREISTRTELAYMGAQLLSGGGSECHTGNRWFDKFLQIVVARNGVCGALVEHSASEGITVLRFLDAFLDSIGQSKKCPVVSNDVLTINNTIPEQEIARVSSQLIASQTIRSLKWDFDDLVRRAINNAIVRIDRLVSDLDFYVLRFEEYGKQFIKSKRFSPDAYIQLALQLTYYRVHRRLVSTYESAGLRQFKLGRVDNIRAATFEALNWVQSMCDEYPGTTKEYQCELFTKAMNKQVEVLKYTIAGHGPDNHLLGLREMSRRRSLKKEPSAIFLDNAYTEYLNYRLSTSQLPNENEILVGYGAVVTDGYGCSYNPVADAIIFCVGSFRSCSETDSEFFAANLKESLHQMRELCLKLEEKK